MHTLLVRIKNGTNILENSVAISYKTKDILAIRSSKSVPRNLSKINENFSMYKGKITVTKRKMDRQTFRTNGKSKATQTKSH